jgi:hypothetical protein
MARQPNYLKEDMSLHEIKDKMQLRFAEQQAEFIINNLHALIERTHAVAPVRRNKYCLSRDLSRHLAPHDPYLEKHWEEAIFRKWNEQDAGLDRRIPFRKVVSYQVMLRDRNKDSGWGEIDLLGATAENVPVVIELKIKPSEYLLRAIVEALAYGVALRKAWNAVERCRLHSQWQCLFDKTSDFDSLPLVVIAPDCYWQVVLSDSSKHIRFQTPPSVHQSIKTLLEKMHSVGYPLTFVAVRAETRPDKSDLPVIFDAVTKKMA